MNDYGFNTNARPQPMFAGKENITENKDLTSIEHPQTSVDAHELSATETLNYVEDYVLTIDEAWLRFKDAGIDRSPQSIRRWVRDGQILGQRLGVWKTYRLSSSSVDQMIADLSIDERPSVTQENLQTPMDAYEQTRTSKFDEKAGKTKEDINVHEHPRTIMSDHNRSGAFVDKHELSDDNNQQSGDKPNEDQKSLATDAKDVLIQQQEKTIERMEEEIVYLREAVTSGGKDLSKVIEAFGKNAEATLINAQNGVRKSDDEPDRKPVRAEVVEVVD